MVCFPPPPPIPHTLYSLNINAESKNSLILRALSNKLNLNLTGWEPTEKYNFPFQVFYTTVTTKHSHQGNLATFEHQGNLATFEHQGNLATFEHPTDNTHLAPGREEQDWQTRRRLVMNQRETRAERGLGTGGKKGHSSDAVALSLVKDLHGSFWWDCAPRVYKISYLG